MSVQKRILTPILSVFVVGFAFTSFIFYSVLDASQKNSQAVQEALAVMEQAEMIRQDVEAAQRTINEVVSMTRFVPMDQAVREFEAVTDAIKADFTSTELQSQSELSVLNGENAFAIGSEETGWEIVQAQTISYEPDGTAILTKLLRGRLGSEALMPMTWSAGTTIIALNEPILRFDPTSSEWDQQIELRIGPANKPVSDESFVDAIIDPNGVGLAPYAPALLIFC